jgi:hypothetical protein
MPQKYPHQIGVSEELYNRLGRSPSHARDLLWQATEPNGHTSEPETNGTPERVPGTLIVTNRRTRCPKCKEPVERDADAVMMDGTEFGYGAREAFHVGCAVNRGWRRS